MLSMILLNITSQLAIAVLDEIGNLGRYLHGDGTEFQKSVSVRLNQKHS